MASPLSPLSTSSVERSSNQNQNKRSAFDGKQNKTENAHRSRLAVALEGALAAHGSGKTAARGRRRRKAKRKRSDGKKEGRKKRKRKVRKKNLSSSSPLFRHGGKGLLAQILRPHSPRGEASEPSRRRPPLFSASLFIPSRRAARTGAPRLPGAPSSSSSSSSSLDRPPLFLSRPLSLPPSLTLGADAAATAAASLLFQLSFFLFRFPFLFSCIRFLHSLVQNAGGSGVEWSGVAWGCGGLTKKKLKKKTEENEKLLLLLFSFPLIFNFLKRRPARGRANDLQQRRPDDDEEEEAEHDGPDVGARALFLLSSRALFWLKEEGEDGGREEEVEVRERFFFFF